MEEEAAFAIHSPCPLRGREEAEWALALSVSCETKSKCLYALKPKLLSLPYGMILFLFRQAELRMTRGSA